jgi:hypothetical protein
MIVKGTVRDKCGVALSLLGMRTVDHHSRVDNTVRPLNANRPNSRLSSLC